MSKQTTTTAYKVVRLNFPKKGQPRTFRSSSVSGSRTVTYEIDRVARPNKGENPFLWVFRDVKSALRFCGKDSNTCAVLKGVALNPRQSAQPIQPLAWRKAELFPHRLYAKREFQGTLFCDAFVPLQVMKVTEAAKGLDATPSSR